MEEGESLLLMFLGLHSFCHNTTHTFFQKKNSRVLAYKQYVWECSTTLGRKMGVLTLCGSRSRCVDGGSEDRGLSTESHWCGVGGFSRTTSN